MVARDLREHVEQHVPNERSKFDNEVCNKASANHLQPLKTFDDKKQSPVAENVSD